MKKILFFLLFLSSFNLYAYTIVSNGNENNYVEGITHFSITTNLVSSNYRAVGQCNNINMGWGFIQENTIVIQGNFNAIYWTNCRSDGSSYVYVDGYSVGGWETDYICPDGSSIINGECSVPPCIPLSEYTVNIPKSDCQGNIQDTNNQVSGILSWQDCDNTCYITEAVPLTCDELGSLFKNSCDTSKNNFSFSCSDIDGAAVIDTLKTFCKPKSNPCDDMYDIKITQCSDSQVLIGYPECRHNGNNVINPEVFKCVDNNSSENPKNQQPWDCVSAFNKIWDDSTKSCDCMDGYELSFYGSCKKILDSNATSEQIDNANNEAKNNSKEKQKEDFDRNQSLESNKHLSNIENTLSIISNDINNSKSLLGDIKGLIGKISDSFDSNNSNLPSMDMGANLDNLKSNYSTLDTSIDELKSILLNGLVNPIPSGSGGSCAYNNVISGNGMSIPVNINPCIVVAPYYSTLYSIWYVLFFIMFLVLTFKILLYSRED